MAHRSWGSFSVLESVNTQELSVFVPSQRRSLLIESLLLRAGSRCPRCPSFVSSSRCVTDSIEISEVSLLHYRNISVKWSVFSTSLKGSILDRRLHRWTRGSRSSCFWWGNPRWSPHSWRLTQHCLAAQNAAIYGIAVIAHSRLTLLYL